MAVKKAPTVRIRVRVSFNGMHAGDEATVELNQRVEGWLNAGFVEVVDDGTDPAGPGSAEPSAPGRVTKGAGGGIPSGGEQGQGFGTGGYGSAAS